MTRRMLTRLLLATCLAAVVLLAVLAMVSTGAAAGHGSGLAWIAFATCMAGWRRPQSGWAWSVLIGGLLGWLAGPVIYDNGPTWLETAIHNGAWSCLWATLGMGLGLGVPPLVVNVYEALELGS